MSLLRTADAAKLLGVGRATLRRLEERGRLHPSRDARGHRVFSRSDLERVDQDRRLVPTELESEWREPHAPADEQQPVDAQPAAEAKLGTARVKLLKRRLALEAQELSEREAALASRVQRRRLSEHRARFGEARAAVLSLYSSGELKSLYLMTTSELRELRALLGPIEEAQLMHMGRYELRKAIQCELVAAEPRSCRYF